MGKFSNEGNLLVCKRCGDVEKVNDCGNYFLEIKEITKKLRTSIKLFPIPEKYTHYIYAGFGSIYDSLIFFLTKAQAKNVPEVICDDCFSEIFGGRKLMFITYFELHLGFQWKLIKKCCSCGQLRNKDLAKTKGELFTQKRITKNLRRLYNIDEQYQSYIEAYDFFNFQPTKEGLVIHDIFLLKEKIASSRTICTKCLHQKIKGQKIAVINLKKCVMTSFVVK